MAISWYYTIPLMVKAFWSFCSERFVIHIQLYSTGFCPVLCAPGLDLHWTIYELDFSGFSCGLSLLWCLGVLVIIVTVLHVIFVFISLPGPWLAQRLELCTVAVECCTQGRTNKK